MSRDSSIEVWPELLWPNRSDRAYLPYQPYIPPSRPSRRHPMSEQPPLPPTTPKITDETSCYLVVSNTDLTEGRGRPVTLYACQSPSTARRLAEKKGVMGSDATVASAMGYKINDKWYYPVQVVTPTDEDNEKDRINSLRRSAANKIKASGLSKDELASLGLDPKDFK